MSACANVSKEIASILIDKGADVNLPDDNGNTPLRYACETDNKHIISLLIQNGAIINGTALAMCSCKDALKELIDHCDIQEIDMIGRTFLMYVCEAGNIDAVMMLVESGADLNVCDTTGMDALGYALEGHHTDIVSYLLCLLEEH